MPRKPKVIRQPKRRRTAAPLKQLKTRNGQVICSYKHLVFAREYVIDMDPVRAAKVAGYENPQLAARRLLEGMHSANPSALHLKIQQLLKEKESVAQFKADDVLRLLQCGAFLDMRPWFEPGDIDGKIWKISEQRYAELPADIARLITAAEYETRFEEVADTVVNPDTGEEEETGSVSVVPIKTGMIKVKIVDRELMMGLVGKHMLGNKIDLTAKVLQIDWTGLSAAQTTQPVIVLDPIEEKIKQLSAPSTPMSTSTSPPTSTPTLALPSSTNPDTL